MKKIILSIFGLILIFGSCSKLITWDTFALQKMPFISDVIKINGYYYELDSNDEYTRAYCLYSNGILLSMGGRYSSLAEMEDYIKREFISSSHYKNNKSSWGLFVVTDSIFQMEKYYPTDDINKSSYIREGKILSDTSFHITVSYRSDGSERRGEDETYHFKQFSPKPDSTNDFVK